MLNLLSLLLLFLVHSGKANELVILLANQTMFRFTGLDFAALRAAIGAKNLTMAAEVKRKIAFERVSLADELGTAEFEICDVSSTTGEANPQVVMCGNGLCTTFFRLDPDISGAFFNFALDLQACTI